jgi:hypothetical protein
VQTGGFASIGFGDNQLFRSEAYSGYAGDSKIAGRTLSADAAVAYSESEGSRSYGDHEFVRYNARLQLSNDVSQTDLFAGYQEKFMGWVNLYATGNTPETDDVDTTLFALNHRVKFGADGDYLNVGAYYREKNEDYEYNRFIPGLFNPYEHTTYVRGAGLDGRASATESLALRYRAGIIADKLRSTALRAGDYNSRSQVYAGLFPEYTMRLSDQRQMVLLAGANYDDSNRDDGRLSPSAELALLQSDSSVERIYVSYSTASQLPTYTTTNSSPVAGPFRGNASIDRATVENYEIGASGVVGGWHSKAAVFYRKDDGLADWVRLVGNTFRTAQAIDVDTTGVELVTRRNTQFLDFVFGYAWMTKSYDYGAPNVVDSFYALNYAEHRLTAAIIARLGGGFELRLDNEARIQEENALRTSDDEVVLSSIGLYYAVPRVKGLTLSAQIDNLWNTYYEEVPLVPGSRREFSVGARYAW